MRRAANAPDSAQPQIPGACTATQTHDPPTDPVVRAEHDVAALEARIREGRFGRALALLTGGASLISGLEVAYEHYKGSYSNRIMYTPVLLSGALTGAAGWAACNARGRLALRAVSFVTLADALVGFGFHVNGVARKPGGWSLPVTNVVMGPPLFAPLLFGTAAYLGAIASYLRREESSPAARGAPDAWLARLLPARAKRDLLSFEGDLREGRFQRHLLVVTALSALLSGIEALYSHYKNNFRYRAQWTPVALAPLLAAVSLAALGRPALTRNAVPAASLLATLDAAAGFWYHARGILRRPGGTKHLAYNLIYGPPIFAPLLFGAAGGLGLLACLLRRSDA